MSREQKRGVIDWRLVEDYQRQWKGFHPAEPPPQLDVLPLTPAMTSLLLSEGAVRPQWGAAVVLALMGVGGAVFFAALSLVIAICIGVLLVGIAILTVCASLWNARGAKAEAENGTYVRYRGPIAGHERLSNDSDTPNDYWITIPLSRHRFKVESKVSDYFRVPKDGQVTFTEQSGLMFEVRGPNGERVYRRAGYTGEVEADT